MFRAKLQAPTINTRTICRTRLMRKLACVPTCRLTMVIAPAGYGKTTAVLHWVEACGLRTAWLSLDPHDNNPSVFWPYFCSALDSIVEGISAQTEYMFSSPEMLRANMHIDVLVDKLANTPEDFVMVLDDLHNISDLSIMEGLSHLLDYLPAHMHLVFISRSAPDMRVVRHKLKWQVQLLEEKDLRLDEDEILQFYRARGISMTNSDVGTVKSHTEGWVAALVALAMSVGDNSCSHDIVDGLDAINGDVGQYLNGEILRLWSPEKRDFATQTSILDTLTEDICNAVTEQDNARRMLTEIYEGSGFLFALEGQHRGYRHHPLFRSFLQQLLAEEAPDKIAQLHARAGLWFREQGMVPEAIEHLLAGGRYQEALDLIEHRIDSLIRKNDFDRILSWVESLPDPLRSGSFKVAAIYSLHYAEAGRLALSREWLMRMKARREQQLPYAKPEWGSYSRTVSILIEANLLSREGNVSFPALLFSAAEGNSHRIPEYNDFNVADIYFYRCPINVLTRLFREAPEEYHRMTESYRGMISQNPGYAPLAIGEYYYESNRLDQAMPYLLKAIEEAQTASCPGALVPAMVDLARIKRAEGDVPGALDMLQECEDRLQGMCKIHWHYLIGALRCRLQIDMGASPEVQRWLEARKLSIFSEVSRAREFELIVYARALVFARRQHDAKLLLQRLLTFAEGSSRLHSQVEILNLLALLDYRQNNTAGAVALLEQSLAIGLAEGYVRSYLDELAPMAQLLSHYTSRRSRQAGRSDGIALAAFGKQLLRQMQESVLIVPGVSHGSTASGIEQLLTGQEMKVLELLFTANTNKEIAEKLCITPATVKTHISNIYSKLGVRNRAQCTKLVREIGLME